MPLFSTWVYWNGTKLTVWSPALNRNIDLFKLLALPTRELQTLQFVEAFLQKQKGLLRDFSY